MAEDSDADVVKIVIHQEGRIRLIVRQSMAEVATGLGVEQFPTALGRVADGVGVSSYEIYPGSFAQATYWGINSLTFTNAKGQSVFVRYRFIPRAGEKYLTPDERKAKSASYLQDEIVQRIAKGAGGVRPGGADRRKGRQG